MLRIADWLVDPARPLEGPHAYLAMDNQIPFRGVCGEGHWTVKAEAATQGPLCPVCREVIAGAAFRALEYITNLEAAGVVPVLTDDPGDHYVRTRA